MCVRLCLFVVAVPFCLCMRVLRVSARVLVTRAFVCLSLVPYKVQTSRSNNRTNENAATAPLSSQVCQDGQGDDASRSLSSNILIRNCGHLLAFEFQPLRSCNRRHGGLSCSLCDHLTSRHGGSSHCDLLCSSHGCPPHCAYRFLSISVATSWRPALI